MHLVDTLSILDNTYPEGLHNIIVHIFDVVLKYGLVLPPNSISILKPELLLKVCAKLCSTDGVLCCVVTVYIVPSPELFHGNTISRPEVPLIPSVTSNLLL